MSQVKEILQNIGIQITAENSSGFAQFCPTYRGSKNPYGASIDLKTGWVTDWSQDKKFPIDVLVKLVTGENLSKKELDEFKPVFVERDEKEQTFWSKEDCLTKFLPNHDYWLKRGISKETLDFFQGGVSHGGKLYNRYVWPVFDRYQRIIGFTGRDLTGKSPAKYKHEGVSNRFLFGLFNKEGDTMPVLADILNKREIILVEGPSDSVACYDEGARNVLPTFGLNISKSMMSFLLGVNPDKITITYNNDDKFNGQDGAVKNFAKLAEYFDLNRLAIKYPIGNDLADNKSEIKKWVDMEENCAIVEFRNKFKRNGKMTKNEIKVGKELATCKKK